MTLEASLTCHKIHWMPLNIIMATIIKVKEHAINHCQADDYYAFLSHNLCLYYIHRMQTLKNVANVLATLSHF